MKRADRTSTCIAVVAAIGVVVIDLGFGIPGIETIKAEPIPCKGGIEFRNRPLCLISGWVYVDGQCEELDLDMFGASTRFSR